jgi:hypothetical protein
VSPSARRSNHPQRMLSHAWFAGLSIAALLLLVPDLGTEGAHFAHLATYPADIVQNVYRLIRVAMPLLPVGMLLALVLSPHSIRLAVLACVVAGVGLAFATMPGAAGVALARDLLFVIPGVAAGVWLAERSRLGIALQNPSLNAFAALGVAALPRAAPDMRLPAAAGAGGASDFPGPGPASRNFLGGWMGRALGVAGLVAAITLAAELPRWGSLVAVGLCLYAAMLWWRPLVGLAVVPAAVALLDLAPWTGRFFLDEFDLLMLTTLALGLWQGRLRVGAGGGSGRLGSLLFVFVLLTGVSLLLGLFPLQAWDVNAWSAYWSHYNSLRVGKGLLWGLAFYGLYRSCPDRSVAFAALCTGMAVGVLGVGLWALREQILMAGAVTTMDYRVTGSFSSMHTGGGHFEAYLVIALPFVWGLAFRSRHWLLRALLALVFVFGSYALLTTVARGGAIALALALVLLIAGTWRARAAAAAYRVRPWQALLLGLMTLAAMFAGVSGAFWQQRLAQTIPDVDIRVQHWAEVLTLRDANWWTPFFGQGLGSLPARNLAHKLPTEAGSYRYGNDDGTPFLALNSTNTLYMAQRVDPQPGTTLTLHVDARTATDKAELEAALCEKSLFSSRQCQWLSLGVKPGTQEWQVSSLTFSTGSIGAGNWLTRRPVQFSLYNPVRGTVIDVTHVRLLDASGRNLLQNGDFAQGGDFWFFKSNDHLFWHAKNLWVQVLFEQGWLGVLALAMIVIVALTNLARPFLRGSPEATVWLAGLVGMLTVGVVDGLMDAPRIALMTYFILFCGASFEVSTRRLHFRHMVPVRSPGNSASQPI